MLFNHYNKSKTEKLMSSAYSGFATKKLERTYNLLVSKLVEMLQDKIIYQSSPDFLNQFVRDEMADELRWAKKLLSLYRNLRQLEKRKYSGDGFSLSMRQLASYYAVKFKMWDKANLSQHESQMEDS